MHFCAAYERMLPPEATDCVAARRQFNATPGIKARFTGHLHGIDSQMARHIAPPPSVNAQPRSTLSFQKGPVP